MVATRIPQLVVVASFIAGLMMYGSWSVHHDVAWLMYCGQRMFQGARLYVDCIEVNPPISFYLTLLPAYFAQRFDFSANLCLAVYVLALAALSVGLSFRILSGESRTEKWWVAAILSVALIFTVIKNFGQREHFAVILALPYLFCCSSRMSGHAVSRPVAFIAGVMSGVGFSIKHYFLLVPLAIETLLAVRRRSLSSLNRAEIHGAMLAGASHAIFVAIAHPEYFTSIVPMAVAAYNGYALPYLTLVLQPWCLATGFALVGYHCARRIAAESTVANVLAMAAAVFFTIYFIQDRGWQYHLLPAQVLILAASLIMVAKTFLTGEPRGRRLSIARRPLIWLSSIAIVGQVLVIGRYSNVMTEATWRYIEEFSSNRTYYVLSPSISMGFPLPIEQEATWGSRFPFQWLLPGVVKGLRDDCPDEIERCAKLEEIRNYVIDSLVEDFERYEPGVVFVDLKTKEDPDYLYSHTSFDMLAYFVGGSDRFAQIWKHYQLVDQLTFVSAVRSRKRTFEVWVRRTEPELVPAQSSLDPGTSTNSGLTP